MSDPFEGLDKALSTLSSIESSSDRIAQNFEKIKSAVAGVYGAGGGGGGGGFAGANKSSSTTGGAGSSGGLIDTGSTAPDRTSSTRKALFAGIEMVGAVSSFLPTAQEAMNIDAMANRMRFYGQAQSGTAGGAYGVQRALSGLGTATSAIDANVAANMGAGVGLLPGLSNYRVNSSFGGVLGGAALASNLTPGMGLQGGMQAMGGLNQARNVNMLKMIGVNVRDQNGQMNDLPDIIGQVYKLLEQSSGTGGVTPQAIAVSAMSGNALDSILNQYFGNDANLRQTVLSGLLQMANSKGVSLRTSGTKGQMIRTGGSTGTLSSLSTRYTQEQDMLQQWSRATNEGFAGANRFIGDIYSGLAKIPGATGGDTGNQFTSALAKYGAGGAQAVQAGLTGLEVFAGARGGAGGQFMNAGGDLAGALLPGLSSNVPSGVFKAGGIAAGLGIVGLGAASGANWSPNETYSTGGATSAPTGASYSGPVYTGGITINVTAPVNSSDATDWAAQLAKALQGAASS